MESVRHILIHLKNVLSKRVFPEVIVDECYLIYMVYLCNIHQVGFYFNIIN